MTPQAAPTALISWAHRNVGWSDTQVEDWTALVVQFAMLLRRFGIAADLDLWHESDTTIDWTRWGQLRILECDYTVIIISAAWRQRWEGSNDPTMGAGVAAEADALKGRFATNQDEFQKRTILVLLPGITEGDIPLDLHRLSRFRIETFDLESAKLLLRALSDQPTYVMPALGAIPELPPHAPSEPPAPLDSTTVRRELGAAELAIATNPNNQTTAESRQRLRQRISRARGTLRGLGEQVPLSQLDATLTNSTGDSVARRDPSDEQEAILNHAPSAHGVVLTGPGTGKSTTLLELIARIRDVNPDFKARIITFTRAATAELYDKIRADGHLIDEPATVHSFALSILMRNPDQSPLPLPLRIPDDWEGKNLIVPDLAHRLRQAGFNSATPKVAKSLVDEMSAGWDSLDPDRILLVHLEPELRSAFRACWGRQRNVFGYSLFAEMTYSARVLLVDHPTPKLGGLEFLIVDEYQDLNSADIAMIEAVANHGVAVLAAGDDDQSIYGFRHAAPQGIQNFANSPSFPGALTYPLSTSYRCGRTVLAAARELIESSPTRLPKRPLRADPNNSPGTVAYLRFPNQTAEIVGVAECVAYLVKSRSVPPDQIIILIRSDFNGAWSKPLRAQLSARGIEVTDVEQFRAPLATNDARQLLATARLMMDDDDLAWWTLLKLTNGIGGGLARAISDEAAQANERFSARLRRLPAVPLRNGSDASKRAVRLGAQLVERIEELRTAASQLDTPQDGAANGWFGWLATLSELAAIPISEELRSLLVNVSERISTDEGLRNYLDSLERVAQDIALDRAAVAIMSMARSKGLTRTAVFAMGVEEGILPSAREGSNREEERRLLYVAMTRARQYLFLSMASQRVGPTARTGGASVGKARLRSSFFMGASLEPVSGPAYVAQMVAMG